MLAHGADLVIGLEHPQLRVERDRLAAAGVGLFAQMLELFGNAGHDIRMTGRDECRAGIV